MQLLATGDQMQKIDRIAINKVGIPGLILMENAGRSFVDELSGRVAPIRGKRVVVVCGKGNNGGDGYVLARHLLNRECSVDVVLLCRRQEVRGDAKTNLDILFKLVPQSNGTLRILKGLPVSRLRRLQKPDIVVDAMFGTGFRGKVRGTYLAAIQWMNRTGAFVASVDICSGADASTGIVENEAVHADLTITFGVPKVGQFVGAGRENSGDVVVTDISIPQTLIEQQRIRTFRIGRDDVSTELPTRSMTAHKYGVGKVFVLAGSRKFTGAPFMTAQAAMRTGAGAVIVGLPKSVQPILARKFTEVMISPLDETSEGSVSLEAYEAIMEKVRWADSVAIGPGLTRDPETRELLLKLIPAIGKPLVIDADALAAVGDNHSSVSRRKYPTILTPHAGELAIIAGKDASSLESMRVEAARNAAKTLRCIICLKGSPTVTAVSTGEAYLNSTGNPGMATIGSGDVLTGIIACFASQHMRPDAAAYSGVFVHGLAGDVAAREMGQRSLMALDIMNHIPDALKELEKR